MAIDEERLYFVGDVVCAPAIHDGRFGQWHPCHAPQDHAERVRRGRPVYRPLDSIRADLNLDAGGARVQPTRQVASRPTRDHGANLLALDRKLRHLDHVAVDEVLKSGVRDEQLGSAVQLVRQATIAELYLAIYAAVPTTKTAEAIAV